MVRAVGFLARSAILGRTDVVRIRCPARTLSTISIPSLALGQLPEAHVFACLVQQLDNCLILNTLKVKSEEEHTGQVRTCFNSASSSAGHTVQ
jgi:hypothetical protein